jgi:hypothetical protein
MGERSAYGARHPGVSAEISQQLPDGAPRCLLGLVEAGPLARGQVCLDDHQMERVRVVWTGADLGQLSRPRSKAKAAVATSKASTAQREP